MVIVNNYFNNLIFFFGLTVHDVRMQGYLEKEKKLDEKKDNELLKILTDGLRKNETYVEVDVTPEEIHLWRYLFHVNSTKIVPTLWQKEKKVPIGPNSPWTITFISPLYLDFPFEKLLKRKVETLSSAVGQVSQKLRCAACKKIPENLKRCSRCRVVFYCSVECQRGHWAQHKATCAKK